MDITTFLQSKGYSRRTIISLLQGELVGKNNEIISYRKEPLSAGDIVTIHGIEPVTFDVEGDITSYEIILFNKPTGYTVSKHDEHNQTIFEILPEGRSKKYNYIGRLDKDSYGLLVLTNATKLVSFFSHPRYQHEKVYKIQLDRPMSSSDIQRGIDGVNYFDNDTQEEILLLRKSCKQLPNNHYEITITEGKKRHIRRLCDALGYNVIGLCRMQFGPWTIDGIAPGERKIITISSGDVENLLENQNSYIQKQI